MRLIIYTDGTAQPNPGPASIGAVIEDETGRKLAEISKYIDRATNNQAEYKAVIVALEKALDLKATEVNLYLDSELVANQLNRRYRVRDFHLVPLYSQVLRLVKRFKAFSVTTIPRGMNREAHLLAVRALQKVKLEPAVM